MTFFLISLCYKHSLEIVFTLLPSSFTVCFTFTLSSQHSIHYPHPCRWLFSVEIIISHSMPLSINQLIMNKNIITWTLAKLKLPYFYNLDERFQLCTIKQIQAQYQYIILSLWIKCYLITKHTVVLSSYNSLHWKFI